VAPPAAAATCASPPTTRPATGSTANGASITPGSGSYLGTSQGEFFFGPTATNIGNALYLYTNQVNNIGGWGVKAVLATGPAGSPVAGQPALFLQGANGGWFYWNGSNWVNTSAPQAAAVTPPAVVGAPTVPAAPTNVESADGSKVTAPGTALETSAGTLIFFGAQAAGDPNNQYGYPMWEGSAGQNPTHNGYAVGLLMLNGGQVYAVNSVGTWYQWGANNWTQLAAAPTLSTPPTTSTVASPQSTATTTTTPATTASSATVPVTAPVTTGGTVGSTVTGEPISDTDIQALVNQMATQGASQQAAYTAILQALQQQGASVTAGLQSQVASQVQATIPAAPAAAASSSNTGLYIVGGGLALVALMFFMNRRHA
jgi:hypothetical protein